MSTRDVDALRATLEADGRPVVAVFRSPLFNASETFVQMLSAAMRKYQPLLIGLEDKHNAIPALQGRMWMPSPSRAVVTRLSGRSAWIAGALEGIRPVLIHAHFALDGLLALPLARRWDVPLVTTLHGHDVMRSRRSMALSGRASWMRYAWFGGRLRRQGDVFLPVANALREHAIAQGFPAERTRTHYLGANIDRFERLERRAVPGLVLMIGRLVEKKGGPIMIAAFARVREHHPAARLVVVGDGPDLSSVKELAGKLGLAEVIEFCGAQPPSRVTEWMAQAALVAIPSVTAADGDSEGFPTVALEAAAAGVPVVATAHMGLTEAVVDGETGLLVPERDPEALAAAISRLLADPALAERIGQTAKRRAISQFSLAGQMVRLEALFDSLVGGSARTLVTTAHDAAQARGAPPA